MADYLYLFRGGRRDLSPQQMQEEIEKWGAWIRQLSDRGVFKGGEPLAEGGKVLTGRSKTVTDGPYAEAKDVVGGFLLITAENLDQATELARGCPIFENEGSLEVREVRQLKM
jgi:hypothetical protein